MIKYKQDVGGFMRSINFYLAKLTYDLLSDENINLIEPVLIKEFKKAIIDLNNNWQELEKLFKNNIKYVFTIDEQMIFTILSSKLKLEFLTKDPEYCGELITILSQFQKSPLNLSDYAKIVLEEPLYTTIINTVATSNIFCYQEFFQIIYQDLYTPQMDIETKNHFLRSLYKVQNKTYNILINDNNNLFEIYTIFYKTMIKSNQNKYIFSNKDFKDLKKILYILYNNDNELKEQLKQEIINIENKYNSPEAIIKNVLRTLNNLKQNNKTYARRLNHD